MRIKRDHVKLMTVIIMKITTIMFIKSANIS